jgi:hypothetical protein
MAQKAAQWRQENRALCLRIIRNNNLKRKFGITIADYEAMHRKHRGRCAICRKPESAINFHGKRQRLAVDHCHRTNTNRGLLCAKCNHAIERIENVPNWARKAAAYLRRHSSR